MGAFVVLGSLTAVGCQNKVHEENKMLWSQNRELQGKLDDAENRARSAPDPAMVAQLQQELASRDQQISQLQAQLRQPQPGQASESSSLAGIEVTRDDRAGTLTVNLPGDVLFASGQAVLKDSAKATLNKVASAIRKDYAGKRIFVDGHTDGDPVTRTKDKWQDNLDLSAERARVVAQYLASQGIQSNLIGTRAFGPTKPKSSKAASRRVEIVVATRD
jgi:chemotaxis protein MotB